jgi:hypothetical protein
MKPISASLLMLFTGVAWGQLTKGIVSTNGISVSFETRLEPPTPGISKIGGGTLKEKDVIKRHLCDFVQQRCFGYDVTVERLADGRFLFKFSPLTITPEKMLSIFPEVKTWTLLPLPQNPVTQVVRADDVLAVDLFVNPSTGQKIVDYMQVMGGEGRRLVAAGPAREFSIEDAPFEISSPRLEINGKLFEATAQSPASVTGSPLWIYIRKRGRFVFSLAPRADLGFQKAGEVRGSTMTWRWGTDEYSLNSDRRIAPGPDAYLLYVFNDPGYQPGGDRARAEFLMGAGDRLESLLRP